MPFQVLLLSNTDSTAQKFTAIRYKTVVQKITTFRKSLHFLQHLLHDLNLFSAIFHAVAQHSNTPTNIQRYCSKNNYTVFCPTVEFTVNFLGD